jgi:diguanylate cyclase (GGDEF)-like protein
MDGALTQTRTSLRSLNARSRVLGLEPLSIYLVGVSALGIVMLAVMTVSRGAEFLDSAPRGFWVFALFVVLCELVRIKILGRAEEITSATSFVFAALLAFGTAPAALAQSAASITADAVGRKPALRSAFNLGHQMVAVAASGAVLTLLSDLPRGDQLQPFTAQDFPVIAASAAAYFLVNYLLAGIASALSARAPVVERLRGDFGFQVLTAAVFLSLAPLIVVAARFDLLTLSLLVLPLIAIYKGGRDALLTEYQALHDGLTDLPNRMLFRDRLQQAIAAGRRGGRSVAVLLMDLDHFKEINDTLGHRHGDLLLEQIGPRLQAELRESDTVARMGGDEFAVLLPNSSAAAAGRVAQKLLEALQPAFVVNGLTLEVTASIGISCSPAHGDDVDTLLQQADVAMFLAKETHSGYELYSPERDHYSPDRLALAGEMRRAVESQEILFYYQPSVEFETGQVSGAEALARWAHPERGLIGPTEFIPIAEQTGLIRPLTSKLLRAALREARSWHNEGLQLSVSVNISARSLLREGFPAEVDLALRECRAKPEWLELEITESTIMAEPERARGVLATLKSMGVRIAIDDFGTGYSSLEHLKQLPVDEVKIDKSFVIDMQKNASDAAIVRSTIDLAHNLGLRVVAEGVETGSVWDELARLGCDAAQGFHLSRAVPPDELLQWIAEHKARAARGELGAADARSPAPAAAATLDVR